MDSGKLRAWWWKRQGLDGSLDGARPSEVLERTGWARSVGGATPYLTLFARSGTGRQGADEAAANLEIHELPSVRGCTYVVPSRDFSLALALSRQHVGEAATARRLGVKDAEIDTLRAAVSQALRSGALDPAELREACGSAVRDLGDAGRKKGLNSTLPVALGLMQSAGEIRRVPVNGRLDQQRYRYVLWNLKPPGDRELSLEEAGVEIARRYFAWTAPATETEFRWFSGMSGKAARDALAPLGLVRLDEDGERLLSREDLEALRGFERPKEPCYRLVASLDGIALLRRNLKSLAVATDLDREVMGERGAAILGKLSDLPSHGIFDRGRLIGLWEFDTEAGRIAWKTWDRETPELKEAVSRTEGWVRDELGDARAFSLDSAKGRAPRIAALRAG